MAVCVTEVHLGAHQEHCVGSERRYHKRRGFHRKFFGSMLLLHTICTEPTLSGLSAPFHSLKMVPSLHNMEQNNGG